MTIPGRILGCAVAAFVSSAAAGCYQYVTVPVEQVERGMTIRAELSGAGIDHMRRGPESQLRLLDGYGITGVVENVGADSLLLSIPTTILEGDYRPTVLSQNIVFPRSEVSSIEVRNLSRVRTGALIAGVAAAIVVTTLELRRGAGAKGGIPVSGGPPENRAPRGLIRWTLP